MVKLLLKCLFLKIQRCCWITGPLFNKDINSSNFETIVDDISSGLDPSASSYIVSSSYPDGNLVDLVEDSI